MCVIQTNETFRECSTVITSVKQFVCWLAEYLKSMQTDFNKTGKGMCKETG